MQEPPRALTVLLRGARIYGDLFNVLEGGSQAEQRMEKW